METDEMPLQDEIAPPMANGEVIFEAPWQTRVFGLARLLCEQGHYDWDEFRACLIRQIANWEASGRNEPYEYFDHFLAALDDLLQEKNICSLTELDSRTSTLAARPHGHDH